MPPSPVPNNPSLPLGYPQPNEPPQTPANATISPPPATIIKHFSHPHTLKHFEIKQDDQKLCSACECYLSGSAYCCTESHCSFSLHGACFNSPREVRHKSHPQHPLTLLTEPPYGNAFTCDACQNVSKAFVYNCPTCSYDLHIDCIRWPETVDRPDHEHPLTLFYSSPFAEAGDQDVTFTCDVCGDPADEMAWVYYCRDCDFGTHWDCVNSEIKKQNVSGEDIGDQLFKLQQQQMLANFRLQMARQNAQFMSSLANSWKNF